MKGIFWGKKSELFGWFLGTILLSLLITIFLILIIKDYKFGFVAAGFIVLLIINICFLFSQKNLLTKIIFSKDGIELTHLKKEILSIKWEDITDIKVEFHGKTRYLTFVCRDTSIDMDLTKKMYDTIMILCPYDHIKSKINDIQYFKYLHD